MHEGLLSEPVVYKVSGSGQLPGEGISYGHSCMQGWRKSQQDVVACAPNFDERASSRHLFAVFDGHGGAEVALYLAESLPSFLLEMEAYQAGDFEQALKDAFLGLDARLLEPAVEARLRGLAELECSQPGRESGSTAVAALLVAGRLLVANVGDSRAVLSAGGGAVNLSEDHKPENELERRRIEAAGGQVIMDGRINGNLNMSRTLGDHEYKSNAKLSPIEQMISPMPDVRCIE